jgi:hypothetical protein
MTSINVLVAVRRENASRYYKALSSQQNFRTEIVSAVQDVLDALADTDKHVDVLILDNGLGDVHELVDEVRLTHPRLFIVLVDEEADFGTPGQADELSTDPFTDNDLIKRITRLMSDRKLETLRADSLPAVRQFAKELRNAVGEFGKLQTAVSVCKNLGYDYVAFYRLENPETLSMTLRAQDGPAPIQSVAPKTTSPNDLMTWCLSHGQSRIAAPQDTPNHPLVAKGRLGAVACVPVLFSGNQYGVLVAFKDEPGTITQDHIMMLELVAAQLGSTITKELSG